MQDAEVTGRGRRLSAGLARLEDALHVIACACLVAIAVLIVFDTLKRSVIGTPLQVQFELTELYLMPAVAVLSLSRVFRDRAHLALEILTPRQFGALWPYLNRLNLMLALVFFACITWKAGAYSANALLAGDTYIGLYDWPMGLAYLSVPTGCGVLCLRLAHDLLVGESNSNEKQTT